METMPRPVLEFWFDFASTYSYVSALRIEAAAVLTGVNVKWVPFLLGPVFSEHGWKTSPFNIYPAKGRYMWRDVERLCADYKLDFKRPSTFPQFALLPTRICVAAREQPWLGAFCRKLFEAEYGEGRDIAGKDASLDALQACCDDPARWIDLAEQPDVKEALRDRVNLAIEKGIFGAPSFVTNSGELFWGNDRLEQALQWARKEG